MTLPLSKTLDPTDYADLAEELVLVDNFFHTATEQHEHRRFEYALALRARHQWLQWDYETYGHANRAQGRRIVDVGGAGSPFAATLAEDSGGPVTVIDPAYGDGFTVEQYIRWRGYLAHEVYCLSVLEHVDDLDRFLYHLGCLVAPGGLLFLTMDACGCPSHTADMEIGDPPDAHHFHWMRRRMFGEADRRWVAERLLDFEFQWFGDRDLTYHGDHVFDYSFASLCLRKRA